MILSCYTSALLSESHRGIPWVRNSLIQASSCCFNMGSNGGAAGIPYVRHSLILGWDCLMERFDRRVYPRREPLIDSSTAFARLLRIPNMVKGAWLMLIFVWRHDFAGLCPGIEHFCAFRHRLQDIIDYNFQNKSFLRNFFSPGPTYILVTKYLWRATSWDVCKYQNFDGFWLKFDARYRASISLGIVELLEHDACG